MSWDEFWQSVSALQLIGWVVGALAVIAFFVKGWPKLRAFVKVMDALTTLPEFMADTTATLKSQDEKIAEIHHQVQYNNGTSVKDSIERIEDHLGIERKKPLAVAQPLRSKHVL